MQFKHGSAAVSASFDDPNLVSAAGLVPAMRLAVKAGLHQFVDRFLTVPSDKGANAGLKVASLVAWISEAGIRLRLFRSAWHQRAPGGGEDDGQRAGRGRPTASEGPLRFTTRRRPADR